MSEKSPKQTLEQVFLAGYEAYADILFRHITFRISDREQALDILQDVFMRTWRYMSAGNEVKNLKALLYTTTHNSIIDVYRKRKPESSLDAMEEDSGFEPSIDETKRTIDIIDGREALKLLKELPDTYRDAVQMRYIEELSLSEIAEITGESENTIAVRIHRGIAKLQTLFAHKNKETHTEKT